MSQELLDFEYFKANQLYAICYETGKIDTSYKKRNVGSINEDGYCRIWCNGHLRMKHRLIYFLAYGLLPQNGEEIGHIDNQRSNNALSNLRIVTKKENNTACTNRKFGSHLTDEQVHKVCRLLATTDLSDKVIAEQINRSRCTVRDIKKRRTRLNISKNYSWKHRE